MQQAQAQAAAAAAAHAANMPPGTVLTPEQMSATHVLMQQNGQLVKITNPFYNPHAAAKATPKPPATPTAPAAPVAQPQQAQVAPQAATMTQMHLMLQQQQQQQQAAAAAAAAAQQQQKLVQVRGSS